MDGLKKSSATCWVSGTKGDISENGWNGLGYAKILPEDDKWHQGDRD